MLLGRTLAMKFDAPDSGKILEDYEDLMTKITKHVREGRQFGSRRFFLAGDLNVKIGVAV